MTGEVFPFKGFLTIYIGDIAVTNVLCQVAVLESMDWVPMLHATDNLNNFAKTV